MKGLDLEIARMDQESGLIVLPPVQQSGQVSVEQALQSRCSVRHYGSETLSLEQTAQLLWAAQGTIHKSGLRTAPSAGALYPLEIYLIAGNVGGLEAGVYHYIPKSHSLHMESAGDKRIEVAEAALHQVWMAQAPAMIVIAAVYARTNIKYGDRTIRYVNMEVGAAAENIYLQAAALELGTVFVGAFYDLKVQSALELTEGEIPLGIMPVGRKG
jgi:SagB-type dehydrogenase family enzyme